MQERKILTLNECLELNRPITLQEAVDLSLEDYTKYLYYKKIINYIPESLDKYVNEHNTDYDPELDIVLSIKGFEFDDEDEEDDSEEIDEKISTENDDIDDNFEKQETEFFNIYLNEKLLNCTLNGDIVFVYHHITPKKILVTDIGILYV